MDMKRLLYNNSRTTRPTVEAAGQTCNGELLWNEP